MPKIETILSPLMFPLYAEEIGNKNVVVIDILRATTTMCIAFENGVSEMVPVSSPEEARELMSHGYLAAAERGGVTVEGFDLGNSPQDYTQKRVQGKKIAITTTNGTRAIQLSKDAKNVLIGSFINLDKLTEFLIKDQADVLLFCAGWKDKFNLEDTLFAGAVIYKLTGYFEQSGDSTLAALDIYKYAVSDLHGYLQKASHVQRFKALHVESDLDVSLMTNVSSLIPVFQNGCIKLLQ